MVLPGLASACRRPPPAYAPTSLRLPAAPEAQRSASRLRRNTMRIDFHSHAFPAEGFRLLQQYYPDVVELKEDTQGRSYAIWANTPLPAWDHAQRLMDMDQAGVDVELLSNPPLYTQVDEHSPALCRMMNDALAESCTRDPDRFKAFAHIP